MSEAKHTPGPWVFSYHDEETWRVHGNGKHGEGSYAVADVINGNGHPQNRANAHLIAAAPTMHALLEQLAENIDRLGHGSYSLESREGFDAQLFIDQVRGVLKATGEQA